MSPEQRVEHWRQTGGIFVACQIDRIQCRDLVDTGSEITLVRTDLYPVKDKGNANAVML